MSSASGVAANKNTLYPSPATRIDSHFYWAMEKFVILALKTPVVSSYFLTLWKSHNCFFKSPKDEQEKYHLLAPFSTVLGLYLFMVFSYLRSGYI